MPLNWFKVRVLEIICMRICSQLISNQMIFLNIDRTKTEKTKTGAGPALHQIFKRSFNGNYLR